MCESHPATIACPIIATPIGGLITVFCPDIVDKQFLDPIRKFWHTNLANVHHNIIVVIVLSSSRKLMDMRITGGRNTCRARR